MGLLKYQHAWLFFTLLAAASGWACRSKLEVKTTGSGRLGSACLDNAGDAAAAAAASGLPSCTPPEEQGPDAGQPPQDPPPEDGPLPQEIADIPQEIADMLLLLGPKKYFQTRDIITVRIPAAMVDGGDFYRILNVTNEEDGGEVLTLLDETIDPDTQTLRSSYRRSQGLALVRQGDEYQFAFYPGETGWEGRFFYGVNKLRLEVDDVEQPRFSEIELTLRDFEVFGMAMTAFADPTNVQVAVRDGFRFQGWVNVLAPLPSGSHIAEHKDASGKVTSKLVQGVFHMVNPH